MKNHKLAVLLLFFGLMSVAILLTNGLGSITYLSDDFDGYEEDRNADTDGKNWEKVIERAIFTDQSGNYRTDPGNHLCNCRSNCTKHYKKLLS